MKKIIISLLFIIGFTLIFWKGFSPSSIPKMSQESVLETVPNDVVLTDKKLEASDLKVELSDYQSKLDRDLKSLPTMDDLQNLTFDEVHHTPEIIKNGGELIGKIQDEAEMDSSKRVDAMSFFKKCTEDAQIAVAIRAVCLNKVYKLVPVWKIPAPLSNVSDEVSDLALKLP